MTSSVFFKFKSQKEPTRVEFDGTGISVFELKRDIIIKSGLGDGTDFDLAIYTEDGSEEYDDDTTIIPRSTTVIARRLPPMKAGAGRAARYVSGKMPVNAKNSSRREQQIKAAAKSASNAIAQMNSAMTEEEKMNAMFAAQTEQWSAQQEEMSHQTPVFKPGAKKPVNVPDHEPPQGYICYRCGEKGHWIQQCPTNDNPEFDNKPRVKRTTGIPKSFLKTVDKATVLAQNGAEDDSKTPSGIMVNADGDFVIAEPDRAAWEQFQAKTKSSAAAQKVAAQDEKELQDRGLLCPIDKKMFIDPMKTPCCAKTYCNDCITNALIEGDLVCPGCQTEGVLIDDLKSDEEATVKIEAYLKEKTTVKAKEEPKSPAAANSPTEVKSPAPEEVKTTTETESEQVPDHPTKSKSPTPPTSVKSPSETPQKSPPPTSKESTPTVNGEQQNSKKRPAEDVAENPKIPKAPKAMQKAQEAQQTSMMNMMNGMPNMPNMPGMPNMPNMMMPFGGMPNMMNPMMMGMPNMNMNNMNMGMMNPMMMGMPPFNNMNGFQGMNGNAGWGMNGMNGGGMNGNMNAGIANGFNPQRPPNFAGQPVGEDDAYFRKPVNPHRHQNRQRRVRPSDYREL
ncbi:putative retinoblastoma-binding protein [Phaeoacremonium minimum UCRPA7]|uniref:Putative retinoblastoma-binding protein n=1 Tax=Phaeoacremonium minimum (strain UCR-PA7) TaxID=1286976 RepID=R8BTB5_PHAM7|nr:putative retinoblastoma-binding protein [Phaeoacremonium minimum UCRPA7]EOO02622.1 putative retinoblastoma-binding protein [Phaeoacremonium minimum UCRPA7]